MPGIQETLLVVIIALVVLYLPKRAGVSRKVKPQNLLLRISGKMRLAIVLSLLWLALIAFVWHPWQRDMLPFIYWGIGPVTTAWSIFWIVIGFRKQR